MAKYIYKKYNKGYTAWDSETQSNGSNVHLDGTEEIYYRTYSYDDTSGYKLTGTPTKLIGASAGYIYLYGVSNGELHRQRSGVYITSATLHTENGVYGPDGYYTNFIRRRNYAQGSYIGEVTAEDGTYPTNGLHTDGFWYVRDRLAPVLYIYMKYNVINNWTLLPEGLHSDYNLPDTSQRIYYPSYTYTVLKGFELTGTPRNSAELSGSSYYWTVVNNTKDSRSIKGFRTRSKSSNYWAVTETSRWATGSAKKGTQIGTINVVNGTYPDDDWHTDGYWYTKIGPASSDVPSYLVKLGQDLLSPAADYVSWQNVQSPISAQVFRDKGIRQADLAKVLQSKTTMVVPVSGADMVKRLTINRQSIRIKQMKIIQA